MKTELQMPSVSRLRPCLSIMSKPFGQRRAGWQSRMAIVSLVCSVLLPSLTGCGGSQTNSAGTAGSSPQASAGSEELLQIVAAENFWGSIAAQVGGDRVKVTNIISNPDTDPHDYEPKPTDARSIATARYVILNGAGYDPWGQKLVEANPVADRKVLIIGDLVGKKAGDNPHLWYSPAYVIKVVDRVTADLKSLDPADADYYDRARAQFIDTELEDYTDTINAIKEKYKGTAIGATESVFVYLADALGLKLVTPARFMNAISEGEEPTAADKSTADQQISQIKVLVVNSQNATPDTDALKQKAQTAGVPVVAVTETLTPQNASFQQWQTAQLKALQAALAKSTGR